MRRLASYLGMVLVATVLAVPSVAAAVGTGNPVVTSPTAGQKLYSGFTGPFVVDFSDAPIGQYSYFVDQVPSGGGVPVVVGGGTRTYSYNGSFDTPQLTVSALPPGTGYTFHVSFTDTDAVVHAATYGFSVSSDPPPRCSIVLPRQVRMAARSALVRATLSASCTSLHTVYAAWQVRDPRSFFAETFVFDHVRNDSWRLYDDERAGVYTVRPANARSSANAAVLQNATTLTMRMDSRLGLELEALGKFVTLRTVSIRYSPSANRFVPWAKRSVVLSYRTCSTCSWHRLKVRTTSAKGVTSYRFRAVHARQYRALAAGTATVWAPKVRYTRR